MYDKTYVVSCCRLIIPLIGFPSTNSDAFAVLTPTTTKYNIFSIKSVKMAKLLVVIIELKLDCLFP